jgi:hypothetical protein
MNDKYCPCGNNWTKLPDNLTFQECYYCGSCDKVFIPTVKELTKEWFKEHYNSDRFSEIKELAKIIEARKKITKEQLIKLGLL